MNSRTLLTTGDPRCVLRKGWHLGANEDSGLPFLAHPPGLADDSESTIPAKLFLQTFSRHQDVKKAVKTVVFEGVPVLTRWDNRFWHGSCFQGFRLEKADSSPPATLNSINPTPVSYKHLRGHTLSGELYMAQAKRIIGRLRIDNSRVVAIMEGSEPKVDPELRRQPARHERRRVHRQNGHQSSRTSLDAKPRHQLRKRTVYWPTFSWPSAQRSRVGRKNGWPYGITGGPGITVQNPSSAISEYTRRISAQNPSQTQESAKPIRHKVKKPVITVPAYFKRRAAPSTKELRDKSPVSKVARSSRPTAAASLTARLTRRR